jgi:hypothetical protein
MANRDTHIEALCHELKISRAILYRYVSLKGELRDHGRKAVSA